MSGIQFYPELLEQRGLAMEALAEAGFQWMWDFASVDTDHDACGLEVTGIKEEHQARAMLILMRKIFHKWRGRIWLRDYGIEPGWVLEIHVRREDRNNS